MRALLWLVLLGSPEGTTVERVSTSTTAPVVKPVRSPRMRVVLLGTGTPIPDPDRAGPSTAVVVNNHAYIVDAGPGVVRRAEAAARAGIYALAAPRLQHVFITHLHSDHTLGLPDLMLSPPVVGRPRPLLAVGPPGIGNMVRYIEAAWTQDLTIRGQREGGPPAENYRTDIKEVALTAEDGMQRVYEDRSVRVHAFAVPHGEWVYAYGYRFDGGGKRVVVSGDTGPAESIVEACDGCDVLVHEVYCKSAVVHGPRSFQRYHGTYHTSGPELAELAKRARPKLLVLSHLLFFGCRPETLLEEVKDRYDGDVVLGEDLGVYP